MMVRPAIQFNVEELETSVQRKRDNDAFASGSGGTDESGKPQRRLTDAARRALAEAEERRRKAERAEKADQSVQREIGGRGGKDPARYGDWEIKGRAIDF